MPRRSIIALLVGAACAAVAVLVWGLAFRTGLGRAADDLTLQAFVALQDTRAERLGGLVAALCNIGPYTVLAAAVTLCALLVRGMRGALMVAGVLLIANLITQYLKPALADPRVVAEGAHVAAASWPSGHSTAAFALAMCAVYAAPTGLRPLTAIAGALFAAGVAASVVLLGWHFPSDALGGLAVAGATTSLALAALWTAEARPAGSRRGSRAAPALHSPRARG